MPVIDWDKVGEDYIPESEEEGFLSHFHIKNCYEFEEWVSSMQEQYNEYIIKSVRARLHEADKMKDMSQIQKYGNILIREIPIMKTFMKKLWRFMLPAATIIWLLSFIMIWKKF